MIGSSIAHFKITAKLGEGGMGEVYRASDTRLHRDVAIKLLPEALAHDSQRMGRLEREAQLLASLNHPNIASIYGIEESEGRKALVMEVVEGEDLADRLQRGPLAIQTGARIALQIAAALESAHETGIIHRDLKPANVKIMADDTVKVLDFGLAKALEGEGPTASTDISQSPTMSLAATQAGIILGTAAYMSPEQAAGMPVDRRCDIWSFGVVLYEILSGSKPFDGETVSHTMADVLRGEIDWDSLPDDLPPSLDRLLHRCLDRNVARRLRDIGEARIALEDYLADPDDKAEPRAAAVAAPSRALVPWVIAGALGLAALAAAGLLLLSPEPESFPRHFSAHVTDQSLLIVRGPSVVLSPDGRRIAWVVDGGAEVKLFTRSLDELEGRELASSTSGIPHSPFFSPDGQWVGYFSGPNLMKAPFAGGTSQTLAELPAGPRGGAWGPDGAIVVGTGGGEGLLKVPAAGGEPAPLTTLGDDFSHRFPQFLPDGKSVIFGAVGIAATDWEDGRLEIVDLESGERTALANGGYSPSVLPSGHLVYIASGTIFGVPFDLAAREARGDPVPLVERVASNPSRGSAQYSFSKNGDLVFVTGSAELPKFPILRVARDGEISALWTPEGSYGKPRLSPDSTKLAVTVADGNNWDIWVFDLKRGVSTRLTFDDRLDTEHLWSPDGQYIVFSSNRDGTDNLYRKRADGSGEVERLTESDNPQWATSFSPDGRYLAMMTLKQSRDLYIVDLEEDGEPEIFLGTEFNDDFAEFSPDGRWIAYSSDESGRPEVFVRPFPAGGGKWQISDAGGSQPRWAADGREMFYRVDEGVMRVAIDGRGDSLTVDRPEQVVEGDFRGGLFMLSLGNLIFNDYDVFPDGQSFVLFPEDSGDTGLKRATFVLGWFDQLKEVLPTP